MWCNFWIKFVSNLLDPELSILDINIINVVSNKIILDLIDE